MDQTTNPWETEPTELRFEAHGLTCFAFREHSRAAWRGYVGVPTSSPLYGVSKSDVIPYPDTWKNQPVDLEKVDILQLFMTACDPDAVPAAHAPLSMVFTSHKGLSFSGHIDGFADLWFFGFDCAHAGDLVPEFEEIHALVAQELSNLQALSDLQDLFPNLFEHHNTFRPNREYRTLDYVKSICEKLAGELAAYTAWPQAQELLAQVMDTRRTSN